MGIAINRSFVGGRYASSINASQQNADCPPGILRHDWCSPCERVGSQTFTVVSVNSLKGVLESASILIEHQEVLVLY